MLPLCHTPTPSTPPSPPLPPPLAVALASHRRGRCCVCRAEWLLQPAQQDTQRRRAAAMALSRQHHDARGPMGVDPNISQTRRRGCSSGKGRGEIQDHTSGRSGGVWHRGATMLLDTRHQAAS
ncbi:hypothetical protein ACJQWK_11681 [Exserohilum turcicum]